MDYFTKEEIVAVRSTLGDVSDVGIKIRPYKSGDEQLATFFDKAKLWRVIKQVISALYIERLASGEMFLCDAEGNEYRVVILEKGR